MTRRRPRLRDARAFTLLEVMVALAILAILMAAITETQGTSLMHGARVFNLTTATQLIDGVIFDLEEEYRLEGFSDNDVERQDCDLPKGFENFECEYDLLGMDVSADNISSLGEQANSLVNNSPLMGALCMGGPGGSPGGGGAASDPAAALASAGIQAASLGALQALANPEFAQLCGVNLAKMCQNIPMLASFIPEIIKQAAMSTRKLKVRITWDEAGRAQKVLEVETYITAVPEAEDEGLGAGGGLGGGGRGGGGR